MDINYTITTSITFRLALKAAQDSNGTIKTATTPAKDINTYNTSCFLSDDSKSGFMISHNGELTSVFSLIKGRGKQLVKQAIKKGACHLDCFDGFLPTFYKSFGFIEVNREANWTAGEPDVVYMRLESSFIWA